MSYKVVKRERERVCGFLLNEAEAISSEVQVSVSGPGRRRQARGVGGAVDGPDLYRRTRGRETSAVSPPGCQGGVARGAG